MSVISALGGRGRRSKGRNLPQLHGEFLASLGYVKPYFQTKQILEKRVD